MAPIRPEEVELVGNWVSVDGKMDGDVTCKRIHQLEREHLVRLADDWSGWERLFRDPNDGRLWERTYPKSEMHGGGPPALRVISEAEARKKYKWEG